MSTNDILKRALQAWKKGLKDQNNNVGRKAFNTTLRQAQQLTGGGHNVKDVDRNGAEEFLKNQNGVFMVYSSSCIPCRQKKKDFRNGALGDLPVCMPDIDKHKHGNPTLQSRNGPLPPAKTVPSIWFLQGDAIERYKGETTLKQAVAAFFDNTVHAKAYPNDVADTILTGWTA